MINHKSKKRKYQPDQDQDKEKDTKFTKRNTGTVLFLKHYQNSDRMKYKVGDLKE